MMDIKSFFDPATYTLTYVVFDRFSKDAVIIDPVLDFEVAAVRVSTTSIEAVYQFIKQNDLNVHYVLETHAHADHITGAHELVENFVPKAQIAIGEHITKVQEVFKKIFNLPLNFRTDGSQFHRLLKDNEEIKAGSLSFKVIFTPGHTPACVSYFFADAVFTGDALFMPDYGTGRCDFPQGDASVLYHSVTKRLYTLPDKTRVFVGHDYQPNGRLLAFETTIALSKKDNIQLNHTTKEADFVAFRNERDATLAAPRLLFPSVQVNIAAGEFPQAEANGKIYLKLPVTQNR